MGTITTPPPTPKRAEKTPASAPAVSKTVRWCRALLASTTVSASFAATACAPLAAHPAQSVLFLDLDGTLAPIVAHPRDARMVDGAREVIIGLRDHLGMVGFISGRGIEDLRRIVDVPGCAYAGNHGFELQFPDGPATTAEAALPWLGAITQFAEHWDAELLAQAGLQVEPKGATLSVHWRTAPDPD